MQRRGAARPHFKLTLEMARASGVNLGLALRDGLLSRDEYAEAIARCRSCAAPDACRAWLSSRDAVQTPPANCRNGDLFAELRQL